MKKKLCVVAMMASLMLWGCTQEEKQAEAPAPGTTATVEQAKEKVEEATETVKEKAKAVEKAVEEKAKTVGEAVEKQAAVVEKKAATVVEKGKQTAADIKAAVKEKSEQIATDKPTTTVETVTIDNKNGKVVLSHKKHAEAHGCAACHGARKPGPLKLGKEAAHALCQGCHKKNQGAPTSCTQCHQKKAKGVEGC